MCQWVQALAAFFFDCITTGPWFSWCLSYSCREYMASRQKLPFVVCLLWSLGFQKSSDWKRFSFCAGAETAICLRSVFCEWGLRHWGRGVRRPDSVSWHHFAADKKADLTVASFCELSPPPATRPAGPTRSQPACTAKALNWHEW